MQLPRILVIGGAGFIGTNLVAFLRNRGHAVAILDDFSRGRRGDVRAEVTLIEGTILSDATLVEAITGVDIVVNAACRPITDAIEHPVRGFAVNASGAQHVAHVCGLGLWKFSRL
jgi:UDP-glucose 4-epimerase